MKPLYHFTQTHKAAQIVTDNRFFLSMADAAESDEVINKGKLFYLSLTRTRSNAFADKAHGVMFELDGRALESRYKLEPMDYWANHKYSEAEERLITDKPSIPASPFIVAVHINLDRNDDGKYLRDLVLACARRKISVFAYNNQKDMISMRKERRVPLNDPRILAKSKIIRGGYIPRSRKDYVMPWLQLMHAAINKTIPKLLKQGDSEVAYIYDKIRGSYGDQYRYNELATGLRNDIGNSRNYPSDDSRVKTPRALAILAKQQGITIAGIPRFIYEAIKDI
ncbi:hypothetical protein JA13_139 [Dickeya phage vB_DsoM_JA13]|uniref:Uncharacterized protein n=1 Tax=Dickeya phage vB_DsoM_JA13 TaxID=2283030 RepID=A0A384ZWC9_9CAUD|nr:hypothetical protein JA13_139 [Dickeya phage vB_DsoM_JA13]